MGLSRLSPLRFSTPSSRNWLAWIAWLFALTLAGLALGLYAGSYSISLGPQWGPRGFMIAFAVLFSTMGVVVAVRRPRNRIGWIYLAAGILSAIQGLGEEYATYALLARPGSLPGGVWMAWLQNWIWVPVVGLYLGYIPLLLPEGHLASPRWRPMAWFTGFATLALSFFHATSPGRLDDFYPVVNPLGMERAPVLWARLEAVAFGLLALAVLAAAASLVWRARRAGPSQRQQLKWVALAGALGAGGIVASFGLGFGLEHYAGLNALLVLGSILGMHLATVVAILRYRLYDIGLTQLPPPSASWCHIWRVNERCTRHRYGWQISTA